MHGFDLNPEDEQLLRGPVAERVLEWVAAAVGPSAEVVGCRVLAGGTSSAVHRVDVVDSEHRCHRLVLRRFVRLDWLAEEPDLAEHEALALRTLAPSPIPTPVLVATDPRGREVGVPAVVMTLLPGRVEWDPPVLDDYLSGLAEVLTAIHRTSVPRNLSLPPYRPYPLRIQRPPAWATEPDLWLRAIELVQGPVPSVQRGLIHRDYHPGNVLWSDRRVSGVVDWVNTSVGSPWADVGLCRVNLAGPFGQAGADRFLHHYRTCSGATDEYDPYWDLAAAIGGLDESCDGAPDLGDERFLADAISRL